MPRTGAPPLTPTGRRLRAQAAAHAQHSAGRTATTVARAAWRTRFERQVDPEGVLPEAERQRRAYHAMRSYMARLALRSLQARLTKAAAKAGAA